MSYYLFVQCREAMDDHATTHGSEGLQPVIFSINTRTTYINKKNSVWTGI